MTNLPKDHWDKFEILSKGALAVLVPAAIGWYGLFSEGKRAAEAERQRAAETQLAADRRSAEVLIQTLSNRERLEAEARVKMFDTLMQHYLSRNDRDKITILELIAMNFGGQFQMRPLFEELYGKLTAAADRSKLRRVARKVVDRQVDQIVNAGGNLCELELKRNVETSATAQCGVPLKLTLSEVAEDGIRLVASPGAATDFEVNYFDAPFTDNSKLRELIYALVLAKTDARCGCATVRLVVFPQHYYDVNNKLHMDDMIGSHLDKPVSEINAR
jgi:hypothetical protein